MKTKVNMQSS